MPRSGSTSCDGQCELTSNLFFSPHKDPFLAPPKTGASHRTIPLPHVVITTLAERVMQFALEHPDGLIFTDEDGHALRRTTFLREIWRPAVMTVQRRLGHATAVKTLDTCSHLWPDSDDRTRDAIDAVLGADVSQVCPKEQSG